MVLKHIKFCDLNNTTEFVVWSSRPCNLYAVKHIWLRKRAFWGYKPLVKDTVPFLRFLFFDNCMTRSVRTRTFGRVRPAKIQISLQFSSLISILNGRVLDIQECKVYLCGQRKLWSARMRRLILSLCLAHMSDGTFSHVAAHGNECQVLQVFTQQRKFVFIR